MIRKNHFRLICLMLTIVLAFSVTVSASAGSLVGNKLRNIKTKTTTGETFDLYKTLEEKAGVIIDLWFVDCYWCCQSFYYLEQCRNLNDDRIAVVALSISDKIEDIIDYVETRGYSDRIIFAKDAGVRGAVRATMFPHAVLVGKGGVILDDELDSSCFDAAIRYAAGLTEKDYADIAEWTKKEKKKADEWYTFANYYASGAYRLDEDYDTLEQANRQWNDRTERDTSYSPESKLSFEVEGEGLRKINVTENANALSRHTRLTRFYIVPDGTPLTVRVRLGKTMRVQKASTDGLGNFADAVKEDKTTYLFETQAGDFQTRFIHPSENEMEDGYSGFITFSSEESAAWYFKNLSRDIGYPVSWEVE